MLVSAGLVDNLRAATPEMVEQVERLVRVESPSADTSALHSCADLISTLGQDILGHAPERITIDGRPHLRWRVGALAQVGTPTVVLVGHFDTVWPLGTLDRWPFAIDGNRATGPGVFDMKAGIVQMFHALAHLPLPDIRGQVVCLLTSDEEIGSPTSRTLIEETAAGARAALILEPAADGSLKVARKGTSMYQLHIEGRAAHAGLEPERGINAGIELAHQILAVSTLGRPEVGTTVTPTVASAGTTTNTVPARAALDVDVRALSREEQQRIDREMRSLAPVLAGAGLGITGGPNRPPFSRASSEVLFDRARTVAATLGLNPPDGVEVGGGSDGNFTAGIGIPTLDGLGAVGAGAHAEGEFAFIDGMPERAALLAGLVADLLAS